MIRVLPEPKGVKRTVLAYAQLNLVGVASAAVPALDEKQYCVGCDEKAFVGRGSEAALM